MSVGKFTSLEEARQNPKLLKQFVRERIKAGQGEGGQPTYVNFIHALATFGGA